MGTRWRVVALRLPLGMLGMAAALGCERAPETGAPPDPARATGLLSVAGDQYTAYYGADVLFMPADEFLAGAAADPPTVSFHGVRGALSALSIAPATYDLSEPQPFDILDVMVDGPSDNLRVWLQTWTPGMTGLTGTVQLYGTAEAVTAAIDLRYDGPHPLDGASSPGPWFFEIHSGGTAASSGGGAGAAE